MNEFLLIISLSASFGSAVLFFRLFGKSGLFAWIGICAIFANVEVVILVRAFGMDQTLGNTLFASSFLATDILSEIYGKKDANKGVLVGILATILFIIFSFLWRRYIPAEGDWAAPLVKQLFANTPRILLASLIAYAVSEAFDVWLYHKWWNLTEKKSGSKNKFLWFRNNFSTLISQLINIVIFNFGAFLGVFKISELISITAACYVIFIATSLLDTPFVYFAKKLSTSKNFQKEN